MSQSQCDSYNKVQILQRDREKDPRLGSLGIFSLSLSFPWVSPYPRGVRWQGYPSLHEPEPAYWSSSVLLGIGKKGRGERRERVTSFKAFHSLLPFPFPPTSNKLSLSLSLPRWRRSIKNTHSNIFFPFPSLPYLFLLSLALSLWMALWSGQCPVQLGAVCNVQRYG
jgi:hypothetical protein